jgi:hypothetical protein
MKQLPAETTDGEMVIRDPRIAWVTIGNTIAGLVLAVLVLLAYTRFRVWLDRTTGFGAFRNGVDPVEGWLLFGLALLLAGGLLVPLPNWVSVGPRRLQFRSWFRCGEYQWTAIESFEVGNPAEPRLAYIMVRSPQEHLEAVRLPAFRTIAPVELVAVLRRKQRVYASHSQRGA